MRKILFTLMTVLLASLAAQAATSYGFYVAGTEVTSDNCNNIVNNYITSGTVSYDPSNNTLFLNNVTITRTGSDNRCIQNDECSGLIVMFHGTCNLTAQDAAVIRLRKTTTLIAPDATDVVNINGVNHNGIWMATTNDFDLTIQGPGTFNIKSTYNTAIEDQDNTSGIQLDKWHEVYFEGVNAVLSSGGNSVAKRVLLRFKAGSSVRFKATNNSSYPVINYCGWQVYGNETLLEPYGAYQSGSYVYDSNGNKVYDQDVYVSDDYVAIINATNFPDAGVRNYMLQRFPKGYITQADVNTTTYMDLGNKSISNLKGIEYFTNLTTLYCNNNNLTSLSQLSGLSKMDALLCSDNQLTSLDLSYFPVLRYLNCSNNKLTTLNASNKSTLTQLYCQNNTLLTTLYCYNDNLTSLNVTGCTALTKLTAYNNSNLTTITGLANCTAITYLDLKSCALTDMSAVSGMTNLANLYVSDNKLTSLNVANKSKLQYLGVYNNTLLTELKCYSCNLTYLDVSGCTALKDLRCYYNANLTTISGLADCTAITYLDCEDCAITSLPGVNNMTNIATLLARNNKLTTLTVYNKSNLSNLRVNGNTTLTSLNCYNNALTSLNVTGCTALTSLNCYNNALTSLNVTGCTALNTLKCYYNANLAAITGLADCTAITYLDCEDCAITDLSAVQNMTNIATLLARNNKLTTLLVIGKTKLNTMRVSGNTSLTNLKCYHNALTSLNVTGCTAMTYLDCCGNQLTSLSVSGCTALNHIEIYKNKISGTGMTTLVNSLPTRSASNKGELRAIYNEGENNSMTTEQITTARNKYWLPKSWNGSTWVELTASTRGDVNGDGNVDIADVTALIDLLLTGNTGSNAAADCNQDGSVNIADVTALIDRLLSGSW